MKTTDEQIIEILTPILEKANAIDNRRNSLCILIDHPNKEARIYCNIFGIKCDSAGDWGTEAALAKVKPYDPAAEKREAIEKLKSELAALENETTEAK